MASILGQLQTHILIDVAVAMVLGALIGLDRELANKPAGLRTHMLVTGASALFVSIGTLMVQHFDAAVGADSLRADPIRVIEAVLTGIAFLGAGTIVQQRGRGVEGLTTAASILFAAGVGVCVALELLPLAIGLTVLILITLRGLYYFELAFKPLRGDDTED